MMSEHDLAPNHHAHYGTFSGLSGLAAALSMVGRTDDARVAARLGDLHSDDVVVDIGCGPGTAVRHAARVGATVTGVDPAPVMLRVARLLTRPRRNIRYVEGVAEALPIPDHSANVVWSIATVHHWTDLDRALEEIRRVLAPRGRYVAIERLTVAGARGHAGHGWTDAQAAAFADRCREHGFANVRVDHHSTARRSTVSVTATAP
jgi:ubiquinone/menaquinone biosynthesis C-methylase UbiE